MHLKKSVNFPVKESKHNKQNKIIARQDTLLKGVCIFFHLPKFVGLSMRWWSIICKLFFKHISIILKKNVNQLK